MRELVERPVTSLCDFDLLMTEAAVELGAVTGAVLGDVTEEPLAPKLGETGNDGVKTREDAEDDGTLVCCDPWFLFRRMRSIEVCMVILTR